jgi:hypothetical protein
LRLKYEEDKSAYLKEIATLRGLLIEIKDIFKFSARGDIMQLPQYLRSFKASSKDECDKAIQEIDKLKYQCRELTNWKVEHEEKLISHEKQYDLLVRCEENEKTITDLKDQLKTLLSQRHPIPSLQPTTAFNNLLLTELEDNNNTLTNRHTKDDAAIMHIQPVIPEIKRTLSTKYQHHAQGKVHGLFTNPSYFYNSSSH